MNAPRPGVPTCAPVLPTMASQLQLKRPHSPTTTLRRAGSSPSSMAALGQPGWQHMSTLLAGGGELQAAAGLGGAAERLAQLAAPAARASPPPSLSTPSSTACAAPGFPLSPSPAAPQQPKPVRERPACGRPAGQVPAPGLRGLLWPPCVWHMCLQHAPCYLRHGRPPARWLTPALAPPSHPSQEVDTQALVQAVIGEFAQGRLDPQQAITLLGGLLPAKAPQQQQQQQQRPPPAVAPTPTGFPGKQQELGLVLPAAGGGASQALPATAALAPAVPQGAEAGVAAWSGSGAAAADGGLYSWSIW